MAADPGNPRSAEYAARMTDADPAPGADPAPADPAPDSEVAPSLSAGSPLPPSPRSGWRRPLLETLAGLGYEEPTPIQGAAIPPLLAGRDLLAEAPTGTGKTAAFALPILQRLAVDGLGRAEAGTALALVLVPTRELAMQVAEAVHRYGRVLGARVLPVYGGQPIGQQLRGLRRGRRRRRRDARPGGRSPDPREPPPRRRARSSILDEADEMLDMGFAEDLDAILSATPADRQTALFSATISPTIARVATRHLREPVRVSVRPDRPSEETPGQGPPAGLRRAPHRQARGAGTDPRRRGPAAALVFARTRGEVDDLAEALSGRGHDAAALHGGLSQEQRDRVMGRFRDGALDVLVATDVAARGLDIEHVSHVVNFDVPSSPDAYVHRIGRTGRAGREGMAITLVEPREHRLLLNIEAATRTRLERATVPSIADLRERRLELLRASLRERLAGDEEEGDVHARGRRRPTSTATAPSSRPWPTSTTRWRSRWPPSPCSTRARRATRRRRRSRPPSCPRTGRCARCGRRDRRVSRAHPARPPWRGPGQAPTWRGPGQGPPATWAPRPPRPGTAPGSSPSGRHPPVAGPPADRPPGGGTPGAPRAAPGSASSSAAAGEPGSGRRTSWGRSRRRPESPDR